MIIYSEFEQLITISVLFSNTGIAEMLHMFDTYSPVAVRDKSVNAQQHYYQSQSCLVLDTIIMAG